MLNSQELCQRLGVSERHAQRLTKDAHGKGLQAINYQNERFAFKQVPGIGGRGWVYAYTPIAKKQAIKPRKKAVSSRPIDISTVPKIGDLAKFTAEEKLNIVRFYNTSKHSLGDIVKVLLLANRSDMKVESLKAKIKRWVKLFKSQGASALQDKRGGRALTADLDLIELAIYAAGTRHNTSIFVEYCFAYADKHLLPFNPRTPSTHVSESAVHRAVKALVADNNGLKQFLHLGKDATRYSHPCYKPNWEYPNQQWEVDATPLDLMIKVPLDKNGIKDYSSRDTSGDYELTDFNDGKNVNTRPALVRVIDNYSKASVILIAQSSNSYSNARLLYKAFAILGMPETLRCDQGKDYISLHLQGFLEDMGINVIVCDAARGDQKGTIERSFRTLQHAPQFELLPGFV